MQTVEQRRVSLVAIDGGRQRVDIFPARIDGAGLNGTEIAAKGALGQLLDYVAPDLSWRSGHAAAAGDTDPNATGNADLGALQLRATIDTPKNIGLSITRLRSFEPVITARIKSLDLAIIRQTASDPKDRLNAAASNNTAISNGCLDFACRYASLFGRQRVQIVVPNHSLHDRSDIAPGALDRLALRYPDLNIDVLSATEATAALLLDNRKLDVIVAAQPVADMLGEASRQLCGAASLAVETRFDRHGIAAGPAFTAIPSIAPASAGLSTLTLALAELLVWLHRTAAARQILGGFARALESGCHTGEIHLMSPCARRVGADEFAAAVLHGANQEPRTLARLVPAAASQQPGARSTPHLTLVPS